MSPLMHRILEEKLARRTRMMALSYPEKVRIVEQMRAGTRQIKAVVERQAFVTKVMEGGIDYRASNDGVEVTLDQP
jgi:hypothetical protein